MKKKLITIAIAALVGTSTIALIASKGNDQKVKGNQPITQNPVFTLPQLNFDGKPVSNLNQYQVSNRYFKGIRKSQLEQAKTLEDLISDFPSNWIENYLQTEIEVLGLEMDMQANGNALKLSDAQMQLLNNLDYGTGLKVNVDFEQKNTVTNALEVKNMEIYLNVIPHAEANFPAGKEALRMYLRDRIANSVYGKLPANFDRAVVWFSINEAGECVEINTAKSSGNEEADQILKEALRSMPKWNPARDEHGKPVIQEFNFTFGDQGC